MVAMQQQVAGSEQAERQEAVAGQEKLQDVNCQALLLHPFLLVLLLLLLLLRQ
jgi:hypothetical protein